MEKGVKLCYVCLWLYPCKKRLSLPYFTKHLFTDILVTMERMETLKSMKIIKKPIDEIIPYVRNNKIHSDSQIKMIAASIKEFGFKNPVIVDTDNNIIAGHGRILAAEVLKLEQIPCIIADDLTPNQIKAYRIADNKLASLAEWDEEMLSLELSDLQEVNIDFETIGFDDKEAQELIDQFSDNPETEGDDDVQDDVDAITKLGDLWQLGENRLLCGDSTDAGVVGVLMNSKKADMVFTDPPYGMNLDTDYSKLPSTKKEGNKKYKRILNDNKIFDASFLLEYYENVKEIFLFGADYYAYSIPQNTGSWIVWDKRVEEKFDKMFGSCFELCWSKQKHKRMIARINNTLFSGEQEAKNKVHPTQKPIKLVEWFFNLWAKKNGIITDPFLGSGSTLIAAEKTNRTCYGMELDPHYCDVIVNRYKTWCESNGKNPVIKLNGEAVNG